MFGEIAGGGERRGARREGGREEGREGGRERERLFSRRVCGICDTSSRFQLRNPQTEARILGLDNFTEVSSLANCST